MFSVTNTFTTSSESPDDETYRITVSCDGYTVLESANSKSYISNSVNYTF